METFLPTPMQPVLQHPANQLCRLLLQKGLKSIIVLFIAWLFQPVSLNAQDTLLDPVTVTSSLTRQRVSATGRNIISIKGETLKQLPIHSIDELLRYLPGIEVQMRGPAGSQSDILVRGGTFQQVLVLLDGNRLNDPLTGHFNSYIPIAIAEIERIEIVKGASSAMYGTEAVGAVIQIISKTFAARSNNTNHQAGVKITAGEYGLKNIDAGGFLQKNNTAFSAGIVSNNADGQPQRGTDGFFHNNTVSASVKKIISPHFDISLRSSYDRRDFSAQNFYTAFTSDTATEKVSSWWNQLKLAYEKERQSFSFDAGYKQTDDEYHFTKTAAPNSNHSKIIQALALYSYRLQPQSTLTTGLQYLNKSITSNDRGDHSVAQAGAFISLQQQLFSNLHINPALRLDHNATYGWELVPQISASWKFRQFILRGNAGKTTRDADFTERYNNYNKTLVTSGNIGNPSLQAEHSFSYEAGADYFLHNDLKIAATYFHKNYEQLIDWVKTPYADMPRKTNLSPTGNYFLAKNISSVVTSGFETDLQYTKIIDSTQSLYGTLGLVWINSNSDGNTPSLYISSHADFMLNFNLVYGYRFLKLALNGIYKQRPEQTGNAALAALSKDYFVLNTRLDGSIIKNKLALFLQADNLFDRHYADRFGVPMPGRWLMAGIDWKL